MSEPGYVYVMINPSYESMVKIGRSTRDPQTRAAELSASTGVPTPFIVAYHIFVADANYTEKLLHTLFEEKGYKISDNREFFSAPLNEVIKAMTALQNNYGPENQTITEESTLVTSNDYDGSIADLINSLEEDALRYEHGLDGYLEDYGEVINLYKKASKLGSSTAYFRLGEIYRDECDLTGFKNYQLALESYKKGIQAGSSECHAGMALLYLENGHLENMRKCWDKFIAVEENTYTRGDKGYWLFSKLNDLAISNQYRPDLSNIKNDILYMLKTNLASFESDGDQKNVEFIRKKMELVNNML